MSQIVFACGAGGPDYPWADPDVEAGIGGSEECVILLARELAKLGHDVMVYNNCTGKNGIYNGVKYKHYSYFTEADNFDLLVAWRDWYLLMGKTAKRKWLWCHDIPVACHCPCSAEITREDSAFNHIDTFVLLNNYHKQLYINAGIPDDMIFVAPIGVDPETFDVEIDRDPYRVLYFSHPDRGLERLRSVWPQIRQAVPEATLASFWWEERHWKQPDERIGILPMAHLGYRDIARECKRAAVLGYPSVFAPEISPATTIKAQFGGAVPVCVIQGGMVDTVKYGFYQGVHQENFARELIYALQHQDLLEGIRPLMMAWAREKYSWASVAALWSTQYKEEIT